jgi:hypothetical protein
VDGYARIIDSCQYQSLGLGFIGHSLLDGLCRQDASKPVGKIMAQTLAERAQDLKREVKIDTLNFTRSAHNSNNILFRKIFEQEQTVGQFWQERRIDFMAVEWLKKYAHGSVCEASPCLNIKSLANYDQAVVVLALNFGDVATRLDNGYGVWPKLRKIWKISSILESTRCGYELILDRLRALETKVWLIELLPNDALSRRFQGALAGHRLLAEKMGVRQIKAPAAALKLKWQHYLWEDNHDNHAGNQKYSDFIAEQIAAIISP